MMGKWFTVASVVLIAFAAVQFQGILANGNSSTPGDGDKNYIHENLFTAWLERPPYTTSPPNGSLDIYVHGMIREAIFRYISYDCGGAIDIVYIPKNKSC